MAAPARAETRRLLLVRHGEAENGHPDGDAARSLTDRGRERFAQHAHALAAKVAITRVVASPYVRAQQTARLLADACGVTQVETRDELASHNGSAAGIAGLCHTLGPGTALVGHNPSISEAAAFLLGGDTRQMRFFPGAVAAFRPAGAGWELDFCASPGDL